MLEWVSLYGQFLFYRTAVDGPQIAHVERRCILADVVLFELSLVFRPHPEIHIVQKQILFFSEAFETVQNGGICVSSPPLSDLFQLTDKPERKTTGSIRCSPGH